jgi:hypothetical protein
MELGSTLEWFAPDDDCTSSLKLFDSIDQWRSLFERSTLGVAKFRYRGCVVGSGGEIWCPDQPMWLSHKRLG